MMIKIEENVLHQNDSIHFNYHRHKNKNSPMLLQIFVTKLIFNPKTFNRSATNAKPIFENI